MLNSCSKMLLLLFLFSISLSFLLYQGLQNLSLSYLPEKAFVYFIINDLLLPSIISSLCLFFLHHFGLAGITIIKKKFHLVFSIIQYPFKCKTLLNNSCASKRLLIYAESTVFKNKQQEFVFCPAIHYLSHYLLPKGFKIVFTLQVLNLKLHFISH